MWKPAVVERALFEWTKWKESIIRQWSQLGYEDSEWDVTYLKTVANKQVEKLGLLSPSPLIELYWVCCVSSDFNIDYKSTFKNIKIPSLWPLPLERIVYTEYPKLENGSRIFPPIVMTEKDKVFYLTNNEFPMHIEEVSKTSFWIFIKDDHEFFKILNATKGRPRISHKPGAVPKYSDRLAIVCAKLKDSGRTYLEIARRYKLPFSKPYESEQSDTVRHLVMRGNTLLSSIK